MRNKLFKKIALATNALVFLQIAFFGFNANAGVAHAVEAQSLRLSAGFTTSTIVAGQTATLTLDVENKAKDETHVTQDYKNVFIDVSGAKDGEIESVTKVSGDFPVSLQGGEVIVGDETNGSTIGQKDYTEVVSVVFKKPANYTFRATLLNVPVAEEVNVETVQESNVDFGNVVVLPTGPFSIDVTEVTTLTATTPKIVKNNNATPDELTVKLDNTYGGDHTVIGKFSVADTKVSDIKSLEYFDGTNWLKLPFDADTSGKNVEGTFGPATGFPITNGYIATSQYRVVFATEKTYEVTFSVVDTTSNVTLASTTASIISDGTGPVVTLTTEPAAVSDASKITKVYFTGNEAIDSPTSLVLAGTAKFTQSQSGLDFVTEGVVLTRVSENKFSAVMPTGYKGSDPIKVEANFVDAVGNETDFVGTIAIDTKAPLAVTNLTVSLNDAGVAQLSWVNPTDNTDVDHIEVRRDGVFVTTLPVGTASYSDASVEKGKTYYYEVVLVDKAGNSSVSTRVDLVVPSAKVAAVASDTSNIAPKQDDTKDVKSESNQNNDTKKNNQFPLWGIILLILLAIVGGYLYWTNDDKPKKPIAQTVSGKNKKTTKK